MQQLLRKCLVGLPESAWDTFLPELQFVLNTTYNRAIGAAPYLLMFGAPATPLVPSLTMPTAHLHDTPSASALADYSNKLAAYMHNLHQAVAAHHRTYRNHAPTPPVPSAPPSRPLRPGDMVLLRRPRRAKLAAPNSGPYLIIAVQKHSATLRNISTGLSFNEHLSNVKPFHTLTPTSAPT